VSPVLCSVREVAGALAELRRVLRPLGELRFLIEHCDRFMHADGALEPAIPHVIGKAVSR
jgi:hypothetical protein